MSHLDHILACNRLDAGDFLPLLVPGGARIGFVRHDHAKVLADYPALFETGDRAVALRDGLGDAARISELLLELSVALVARGVVPELRDEPFDAALRWNAPPLFQVDRGAVPFFGIRGHGAHLNGIRRRGEDPVQGSPLRCDDLLWIGRRAANKKIAPNQLDNIVAGGISAGYDAFETLVKEAEEEAGMPDSLAALARPVSAIRYRFALPEGMRDDVLFVYDIDLPESFVPHNNDGEFSGFHGMTMAECLRLVDETEEFKFNVNLVIIDLAVRHGLIGPDHPDYLDIATGLHGGLIDGPR